MAELQSIFKLFKLEILNQREKVIKEKYQFVQTNESWYEISEREVYFELIKYVGV